MCSKSYGTHSKMLADEIATLVSRRTPLHTITYHSNRMPNVFDRLFTAVKSAHAHETRSSTSGQYFCHPVCSQYRKRSIKFKGPRILQQIDSSLKELPVVIVKKRYTDSFIESYENHE